LVAIYLINWSGMKHLISTIVLSIFLISTISAQFEKDTIETTSGELVITFIGHGSLMFNYNNKIIYADPYGKLADYSSMPKADLILVTHNHGDHFDIESINKISNENTQIILTEICSEKYSKCIIMKNGELKNVDGINIEAVPTYNIVNKRNNGNPYHPKGEGNGYVITFGDKQVYIAGDTENIPEMKNLNGIDIAFVPMNLPYTMTPEMTANAIEMINPKIFYPYHFGKSDTDKLVTLLKGKSDMEIRIRKMK
jgi:L-ascorbate metabolism protein UlaG (beta-lactamase superfamily)